MKRLISVAATLLLVLTATVSIQSQAEAPNENIQDRLMQLGGGAAQILAQGLGIDEIAGKPLDPGGGPTGNSNAPKLVDIGIGIHPTKHENEPTVAANPKNKKNLVAGSHFLGPPAPTTNRCLAYGSADNGATWSAGQTMPQLTTASGCSDPVLAYAPDGSRVYYAYMDIKQTVTLVPMTSPQQLDVTEDLDILVSYSDNDGATWIGPVVALNGDPATFRVVQATGQIVSVIDPGFVYDKPWISTQIDEDESEWVYVSATRFNDFNPPPFPPSAIAFTRSSTKGTAWSAAAILDAGSTSPPPAVLVQGSRPTGGRGGDVLVAWYQSGADGIRAGSLNIRVRHSSDHGVTWGPIVNAATDNFELPLFLGPLSFYKRWWAGMFPDIEIDPGGEAHIVYTHDPVAGNATAEEGDIRYVTSAGPPYLSWTTPVTVNDDGSGRAQGFAAIETQRGGQSSSLHVIWEDSRLSPNFVISTPAQCFTGPVQTRQCNSPNLFYDIFYARKVPGRGTGWFTNFRVSESSSIQDFDFGGDYTDITANATMLFGVWTDRRDKLTTFDLEDDVFGSRIIAGGAAP
jgi:hypothetical protein